MVPLQKIFLTTLTYGRMIKFSHSVFALPFVLSAVVLASMETRLTASVLALIVAAVVAARTAAMGFNRIVDARMDAGNPRTACREIPSGHISIRSASLLVFLSGILFILSAAMLGPLCLSLSIPVLIFLLGYSFTKRFTLLCHYYLGAAIALAPAAAWVALTGTLTPKILLLSAVLFTHIAGFDILYACQDTDFDRKEGLHSIPARLGIRNALRLARLTHLFCACFIFSLSPAFGLGTVYMGFALLICGLLILEHRMVRENDLSAIPMAFFHVNSIISLLLFCGIFLDIWTGRGF
ncbi:putative 4-hydroxybenzoate polyprenyltransferase [Desulfobotulus sp. H1]|uniref:4-hydroxybenzoate polyprenyltransferase n=1 Tax=Desulfobotulus pelophilus TaxID=2823377 RepID=A0ABT3N8T5_9BACT|nr:UbiA-like polyprenyltransferase [Desulfobotulus pelophilus]MCW7753855.1 putative 4-hydroxybenzoate polyprenyltransferase [Desulfobotulus pelophilus]